MSQAKRWTEADDAALKLLLAKGLAKGVIAKQLGRPESSIYTRVAHLELRPASRRRPCMCCGNEFSSEGPHNRLCGRCRNKEITPFHH